MSIVEKIKETEEQAELLKKSAEREVEEMLVRVNHDNENKVQEMLNELDVEIKKLSQNTLETIRAMEREEQAKSKELCDKCDVLAKAHQDEAVDFILKKVMAS